MHPSAATAAGGSSGCAPHTNGTIVTSRHPTAKEGPVPLWLGLPIAGIATKRAYNEEYQCTAQEVHARHTCTVRASAARQTKRHSDHRTDLQQHVIHSEITREDLETAVSLDTKQNCTPVLRQSPFISLPDHILIAPMGESNRRIQCLGRTFLARVKAIVQNVPGPCADSKTPLSCALVPPPSLPSSRIISTPSTCSDPLPRAPWPPLHTPRQPKQPSRPPPWQMGPWRPA